MSETPKNFCGFKTAYLLPINIPWSETITEMIVEGSSEVFKLSDTLLVGWELKATDISGCAGFILEFEVDYPPTADDCVYIEKAIMAFGGDSQAIDWVKSYRQ